MKARWDPARVRRRIAAAPLILEIGANNGSDSIALLSTFPAATLHCFEPEPTAIAQWHARVDSPRATLHELAIADAVGTTTFHRSGGWPPGMPNPDGQVWNESGSIHPPTGHRDTWPWVEFTETIEVATTDLDSWTAATGIANIDIIWADVQGAEGDLVRGASRTLARTRFLYVETSEVEWYSGQVSTTELLRMLPEWKVVERFPNDVLLRNTTIEPPERRWRSLPFRRRWSAQHPR